MQLHPARAGVGGEQAHGALVLAGGRVLDRLDAHDLQVVLPRPHLLAREPPSVLGAGPILRAPLTSSRL